MNPTEFSDLINQSLARSAYDPAQTNEPAQRGGGMVSMGNAPTLRGLPSRADHTERKAAPVLIGTLAAAPGGEQASDGSRRIASSRRGIDTAPPVTAPNDPKEAAVTGSAAADHGIDDSVAKENQRIWELIQTIYQ
jgi:hypothetical protein